MSKRNNTQKVESPCINKCCLDDNDICAGCFRSLSEIKQWSLADDSARIMILQQCDERNGNHKK